MQQYNNTEFRELLVKAIGTSSKQEFSRRAGMMPQQLSRYLREDYRSRPSSSTLKKISEAANDPMLYERLLKACGYEETPAMIRKGKPFEERALLNAMDIKTGLEELTKGVSIYTSIEEFVRAYEMLFSSEDIVEIRPFKKREYNGSKYPKAEQSSCVKIKFETALRECFTWIVLYYSETRGGNLIVVGAATDPRSVYEAGGMGKDTYESLRDKDFVYTVSFKKGLNSKEAFFKAIFGEMGEEYTFTDVGFGFYVPGLPDGFKAFLEAHRNAFCTSDGECALYEAALGSDDPAAVLKDYNTGDGDGHGFEAAIAKIMKEETDLPFCFFDPNEEVFPENIPCIMLPDAVGAYGQVDEEYNLEDLKDICNQYASELGIESYGQVHMQVKRHTNKEHIFKTK